jgi:hypothetical protein
MVNSQIKLLTSLRGPPVVDLFCPSLSEPVRPSQNIVVYRRKGTTCSIKGIRYANLDDHFRTY